MQIIDPRTGMPMRAASSTSQAESSAAPTAHASSFIVDIDMHNFQQVVLEGSMQGAVMLVSWMPQHPDCAPLMQSLEKIVHDYQGAFTLARLNIEEQQQIAMQLRVQQVPDVKLIVQGQMYGQFQGSQPEHKLREWLSQYLEAPQSEETDLKTQAETALAAGDTAAAQALYQQWVEAAPEDPAPRIGLASVLVATHALEDAEQVLASLSEEDQASPEARAVKARLTFARQAPTPEEIDALGDADDLTSRTQRALRAIADGRYDEGLESLLAVMKADRAHDDGAARTLLIQVFEALGNDHPLTLQYRRRMFALLY